MIMCYLLHAKFIEIEVVIKDMSVSEAELEMTELIDMLQIKDEDRLTHSYREMANEGVEIKKDLEYYSNTNKVFWVVNKDVNDKIKANDIVPCIFVEKKVENGACWMGILQLDESIKFDNFKYTTWRKFIGELHGIYVDVLLISDGSLYKLDGTVVDFSDLGRSSVKVGGEYLAKFSGTE